MQNSARGRQRMRCRFFIFVDGACEFNDFAVSFSETHMNKKGKFMFKERERERERLMLNSVVLFIYCTYKIMYICTLFYIYCDSQMDFCWDMTCVEWSWIIRFFGFWTYDYSDSSDYSIILLVIPKCWDALRMCFITSSWPNHSKSVYRNTCEAIFHRCNYYTFLCFVTSCCQSFRDIY